MEIKDVYIVYETGGSKKLYESEIRDLAEEFVDAMQDKNARNGNPYNVRYQIVKVKRRSN